MKKLLVRIIIVFLAIYGITCLYSTLTGTTVNLLHYITLDPRTAWRNMLDNAPQTLEVANAKLESFVNEILSRFFK